MEVIKFQQASTSHLLRPKTLHDLTQHPSQLLLREWTGVGLSTIDVRP